MSLISVIVPVYNTEKWLHEALSSLQHQTYPDFEVILVNDGSSDNSGAICTEYVEKDERFRLISQENRGLSGARNRGLEEVKGEWIFFMDSDDVLPKDSLESLLSAAKGEGVEMVVGRHFRGIPEKEYRDVADIVTVTSEEALLIGLYQKRILNSACGVLYKTTVFNGSEPLRFRKTLYEDLDLFYIAFEKVDKICLLGKVVYYYRITPGSIINTWDDRRLDVLDVTDRIAEHMRERSPELQKAAADRRFSAHFNMLVEMEKAGVDNPVQKERCLRVIKEQRLKEIKDKNVRLKNKIGAFVSYFGMPVIKQLCKLSR